jgi:tRNA (guanine-N7-)-methyltransferase
MPNRQLKDYPKISLKPENLDGMVDFNDIFGRPAPVHIEVGSGKGTFLVNQAQAFENINFLGIEWANKFYRAAVDRIGRWNIANVRIIRTDAAAFIAENVPDESVECFHLYFPDPWPKARHHKRRFFSHGNIPQILRILQKNGIINIATDHADYFEQMQEVIAAQVQADTIEIVPFTRAADAQDGEVVGTNYERKYIKEARTINTIAVKKS